MTSRQAELVTIGTELLLGFTVDTNATWIGRRLSAAGVRIMRRSTVGDDTAGIAAAVGAALDRTGFVITTGGLGPTRDDFSKQVVADVLDLELEWNEAVWQQIVARYARRGSMPPPESNRGQAMVPHGTVVLANAWGTAPGLWIESSRGVVVMLPGVPLEMRNLMQSEVLPRLHASAGSTVIRSATLRTCGIGESTLAEQIASVEDRIAPLTLAYLPGICGVDLRLTAWDLAPDDADAALAAGVAALRVAADHACYAEGDTDLAAVVVDALRARGWRLAVAESCTGGLLGARLTSIPGASDVFLGGVVAYHNDVKRQQLGVSEELIAAHGAVSGDVATAMAVGVAQRFGADVAVAITGIAGPAGGSAEKPVGTVWTGYACHGTVESRQALYGGDRNEIRERAVQGALMGVWQRMS